MEYRGLLSMPEILPMSSMQQLSNDGISFIKKSSTKLCHHIIEINRLISDRINNCKSLFPMVVDRLVWVGVTECLCNICCTEQNFFSFEDRSYLTKLFILEDFDFVIHDWLPFRHQMCHFDF